MYRHLGMLLLASIYILTAPVASEAKPPTRVATAAEPQNARTTRATTASNAFILGDFDFDNGASPDPQGWVSVDRTIQHDVFFHVDNFTGVPSDFGGYSPISGSRSLWCGTREGGPSTCDYASPPGYGNNWDQRFESVSFPTIGDATLSFNARFDCEYNYDPVHVYYLHKSGVWVKLGGPYYEDLTTSNPVDQFVSLTVPADSLLGATRFRIRFESDVAWSDEDGLWNSDGAVIVDNLTVTDDTGTIDFQDFESELIGATTTADGDWSGTAGTAYGDFAALFSGLTVLQEDSLTTNTTSLWGFFSGSTYDYTCGGHPTQAVVPYKETVAGEDVYIWNEVWSPWIPLDQDIGGQPVPNLGALKLKFDVYTDMALDPLVFYEWHVRFRYFGGCVSRWRNDNLVYFDPSAVWASKEFDFAQLVLPGATEVQVAIGVRDQCRVWCGGPGNGLCHSHGPLIDNVTVSRSVNEYVVTNTNNNGVGSLRQAILDVDADSVKSFVSFNIPGPGPHTISPASNLPATSMPVVIDGFTQPGSSPNTNDIDSGSNAVYRVILDGGSAGSVSGLTVDGGDSEVRGLVVSNWQRNGINLRSSNNIIAGNYIGTDPTGLLPAGSVMGTRVGTPYGNNVFGGVDPEDRNVIGGNGTGVQISGADARGNAIIGNYIGVGSDGTTAVGNVARGVHVTAANDNSVGGDGPGEMNVISGNSGPGIDIWGSDSLFVTGNRIGTTADGTAALANAGDGVRLNTPSTSILVGSANAGNHIAHNGGDGVRVIDTFTGTFDILNNSIHDNTGLGIDIGADGIYTNTPVDVWQDTPVLGVPFPGPTGTPIAVVAWGPPNAPLRLQFFESPVCDSSGNGEGMKPVHTQVVLLNSVGIVSTGVVLPQVTPGWFLTATATSAAQNTSEFSACREVINTPVGGSVDVYPPDETGETPVTITFEQVDAVGNTTLTSESCASIPGTVILGDSLLCFNLETDATVSGEIEICFNYDESQVPGLETDLRLFHYDTLLDPDRWVDITTSVDTLNNVVCGVTDHLSPFVYGVGSATAVGGSESPPAFKLRQNIPNPFNPTTTIYYDVPAGGARVNVAIYDVSGRLVKRLVDRYDAAGTRRVTWDGRDDGGQMVASGIYFYRLSSGTFAQTRKMLLLK